MLILTRKLDESIIIGDNKVKLKILSVKGRQVRIGIEADKDISVHREEIYNKIKEQGVEIKRIRHGATGVSENLSKSDVEKLRSDMEAS